MLWVKAFHIIAMVCWFAALFYLPRLFVYHTMSVEEHTSNERFKIMERKLFWGIMTPSAIITILLGFWLVSYNASYYMQQGWFHAKLSMVLLLVIYHLFCGIYVRKFAHDSSTRSSRFYRIFNEIPVLMLVCIIIFVVVKPF